MDGACSRYGREKSFIEGLLGRSDRKRTFWKGRRRWEDNIKMDLQETGWGDFDWIDLARDRDT